MANITTRSTAGGGATVKGSPLTNTELDNNFININVDLGNAAYTTGSYSDPSWITSLNETKVLPSQTGNDGKFLTTNGSATSWGTVPLPSGLTAGSTSAGYLQYSGDSIVNGQINGSTTTPTGTVRLNYEGYLYATKFYGDGSNLTGVVVQPRVVTISDGTSITINGDTTDIAIQVNTQIAGNLTINAPTGTPINGQKIIFRLQSTNVQILVWNSIFSGSGDLTLPIYSTGSSKYDYMGFIYNLTATKWQLLAKNFGF